MAAQQSNMATVYIQQQIQLILVTLKIIRYVL